MSSFVDSKKQQLNQEEIFKIVAKETGGKHTSDEIKASVGLEVTQLKALCIQQGNTIFIVHPAPVDKTIGVFRALNADTINNYLKNSLLFTKAMGLAGFRHLITTFDEPSLLNIFKYVKRNQPFPNMGYAFRKNEKGQTVAIVNLGDTKKGGLPDKAEPQEQGAL